MSENWRVVEAERRAEAAHVELRRLRGVVAGLEADAAFRARVLEMLESEREVLERLDRGLMRDE